MIVQSNRRKGMLGWLMVVMIDGPRTEMGLRESLQRTEIGSFYGGPLFLEEESHAHSHWARRK